MGLKEGQPVSVYCNPKYSGNQMLAILNGLERGVDTTLYLNPKICQEKMRIILYGLTEDKDVSIYLDDRFTEAHYEMCIRDRCKCSSIYNSKYRGKQNNNFKQCINVRC